MRFLLAYTYFRISSGTWCPNQERPSLAMSQGLLTSRKMGSTTVSGSVLRLTARWMAKRWMRLAQRLSCFSLAAVVMLAMGVWRRERAMVPFFSCPLS